MTGPVAKQILFLCTGNYYRSRFAEELFNHKASTTGLPWHATSRALAIERGVENVGPISHHTLAALAALGIEAAGAKRFPLACVDRDLDGADLVVAVKEAEHRALLRERHPGREDRAILWHVHDIDFAAPETALAELTALVDALIVELAAKLEPASKLR